MSGEFGTGKTIFVLAIVVGCFAVLWPKIFYPMLTASVKQPSSGRQEGVGPHARPERPAHIYPEMMHPALREKGRAMPQRTIDKQARPGPMPGVRPPMGGAGGIVPPPQAKGSGAMGIIMPLYTVGIVVFFVYTIMKVLFKKGQEDDKTPKLKDFGLDPEYRKYVFAEEYLDNTDVSSKEQMRRQAREESRSRKKAQTETQPETKIDGSGQVNPGRMDTQGKKLGEWYLPEGYVNEQDEDSEDDPLLGGTTVKASAAESIRQRLFDRDHSGQSKKDQRKQRSKFIYNDIHCDDDIRLYSEYNGGQRDKVNRQETITSKRDLEQSMGDEAFFDDDVDDDEEFLYSDKFFDMLKRGLKNYDPQGKLAGDTLEDICKAAREHLKNKYIHLPHQRKSKDFQREDRDEVQEEVQKKVQKEVHKEVQEEVQKKVHKEVQEEVQDELRTRTEQHSMSREQSEELLHFPEDARLEDYGSPSTRKKITGPIDILDITRGYSSLPETYDEDRHSPLLGYESEDELDLLHEPSEEEIPSTDLPEEIRYEEEIKDPIEEQQGKSECDKKDEQLDQLRRRLEETEKAMERLMCQMGSVTDKLTAAKITEVLSQAQAQAKILKEEVGEMTSEEDMTSSEALTTTMSEDTSLPTSLQRHLEEIQKKNEDSPTSSKGSSPDMDEYEVITKDEDQAAKATKEATSKAETASAKSKLTKIHIPVQKVEEVEQVEEEEEEEEEEVEKEEEIEEEEVEKEEEVEEVEEEEVENEEDEEEEVEEEEEEEEEEAEEVVVVHQKVSEPKRPTTATTTKAAPKAVAVTEETSDDE